MGIGAELGYLWLGTMILSPVAGEALWKLVEYVWPDRARAATQHMRSEYEQRWLGRDVKLYSAGVVFSFFMFVWSVVGTAQLVATELSRPVYDGMTFREAFLRLIEHPQTMDFAALDEAFVTRGRKMMAVFCGYLAQDTFFLRQSLLQDQSMLLHHLVSVAVTGAFALVDEHALLLVPPFLLIEGSTLLLGLAWLCRRLQFFQLGEELRIAFGASFIGLRIVYVPLLLLWANVADWTLVNARPIFAGLLYLLVGLQFYWGAKILSIVLGRHWFRRQDI